jgi:Zinc binding domain
MSDDCCSPGDGVGATEALAKAKKGVCPSCQQAGKSIDTVTLKSLLAVPLTELRDVEYRFCRAPDCPTVYYSVDGEQQFGEDDVRERVHQKHPESEDVFVCYCFRHSPATIRAELSQTGNSSVVDSITAGIKADQCACDMRNPQGSCCLGNVRAVVDRVAASQHAGVRSA